MEIVVLVEVDIEVEADMEVDGVEIALLNDF